VSGQVVSGCDGSLRGFTRGFRARSGRRNVIFARDPENTGSVGQRKTSPETEATPHRRGRRTGSDRWRTVTGRAPDGRYMGGYAVREIGVLGLVVTGYRYMLEHMFWVSA